MLRRVDFIQIANQKFCFQSFVDNFLARPSQKSPAQW